MATISACAVGSLCVMLRFQPSPSTSPSADTSTAPTGISSSSCCARCASARAWRIQCSCSAADINPRFRLAALRQYPAVATNQLFGEVGTSDQPFTHLDGQRSLDGGELVAFAEGAALDLVLERRDQHSTREVG